MPSHQSESSKIAETMEQYRKLKEYEAVILKQEAAESAAAAAKSTKPPKKRAPKRKAEEVSEVVEAPVQDPKASGKKKKVKEDKPEGVAKPKRKPSEWNLYVAQNYAKFSHLKPKERFAALKAARDAEKNK